MITAQLLVRVYRIKLERAGLWAPLLAQVCELYEVNTEQRIACFLAQIGHESGYLRFTREIWGPTAQQLRYEPGTTLAKRLGNFRPGDGRRYMGRGLIQTTGRSNYAQLTRLLAKRFPLMEVPNFVAVPRLLEDMFWAAMSAGEFWASRRLNEYADADDRVGMTKRINGGLNGLADRQALYTRAISFLGE